jgi:hypothetical protein
MRTTVTLDKDVELMLREAMHRERRSFKYILNAAIRTVLSQQPKSSTTVPFRIKSRPLGLRKGIDPAGFNKLMDALEIDGFLEKHKGSRRK